MAMKPRLSRAWKYPIRKPHIGLLNGRWRVRYVSKTDRQWVHQAQFVSLASAFHEAKKLVTP